MPRPALDESERRDNVVAVSLRDDQYARLFQIASALDKPLATILYLELANATADFTVFPVFGATIEAPTE
jgi:hypothetical protein